MNWHPNPLTTPGRRGSPGREFLGTRKSGRGELTLGRGESKWVVKFLNSGKKWRGDICKIPRET